jgi:hypothetical protein
MSKSLFIILGYYILHRLAEFALEFSTLSMQITQGLNSIHLACIHSLNPVYIVNDLYFCPYKTLIETSLLQMSSDSKRKLAG